MTDQKKSEEKRYVNAPNSQIGVVGDNAHIEGGIHFHASPKPLEPDAVLPLYRLPFLQNPHFTGRKEWLAQLHDNLDNRDSTPVKKAIAGLGGMGKTQLVLEYCYRHRDEYALIFWLGADDITSLGQSLADLEYTLGVARREIGEQETATEAALNWLETTEKRWLLVYDNADAIQPHSLPTFIPKLGNGVCLITSRNPEWEDITGIGGVIALDVFNPEDATAFLQKHSGQEDPEAAKKLAEELGFLPLALEHAAAYVKTRHKTFVDYLTLYRQRRQALWARANPRQDYDETITTTWELAFTQTQIVKGAVELLNLCCFLNSDVIPISLFTNYSKVLPEGLANQIVDELARDDALSALRRFSLLSGNESSFSIHRLVQAVGRDRMEYEDQLFWCDVAAKLTLKLIPDNQHTIYHWAESEQLFPHALAVADLCRIYDLKTQNVGRLYNKIGYYLHAIGDYKDAQPYIKRALDIREDIHNLNHPDIAESLDNLGYLLLKIHKPKEAQPFLEKALVIREDVLGENNADTARSLNNLGELMRRLDDDHSAWSYHKRALNIREHVHGKNHPETAESLTNLGYLLRRKKENNEALLYYKRALAIKKRVFGTNHPSTALSFNNLGFLLYRMGEYEKARPYLEDALAIKKRFFSADHESLKKSQISMELLSQAEEKQSTSNSEE